jgi:DNA-binding MarR family transcriptional regulator
MLADKQMNLTLTRTETDEATRLRSAIGRLARRLRHTEATAGMTPTQISVLMTVVRQESLRLAELAATEGLNPTMLSRVLAVLVERGFVRRLPDPDDRRAALVVATAAGRRVRERMLRERSQKLEPLLAELPDDERRALADALPALERLADLLRERTGP